MRDSALHHLETHSTIECTVDRPLPEVFSFRKKRNVRRSVATISSRRWAKRSISRPVNMSHRHSREPMAARALRIGGNIPHNGGCRPNQTRLLAVLILLWSGMYVCMGTTEGGIDCGSSPQGKNSLSQICSRKPSVVLEEKLFGFGIDRSRAISSCAIVNNTPVRVAAAADPIGPTLWHSVGPRQQLL